MMAFGFRQSTNAIGEAQGSAKLRKRKTRSSRGMDSRSTNFQSGT
jgi:hypothetical protein